MADNPEKEEVTKAAKELVEATEEAPKGGEIKGEAAEEKTAEEETKAAAETAPEAPAPGSRARRVRKQVETYVPPEEVEKSVVVSTGKGTPLSEMDNVVANFKEVTWSNPHLKMLHSIVFGVGKKKEFKSHLLEFSGLVYPNGKEETEKEKIKAKIWKLQMNDLKSVIDLVDIERGHESFEEKKNPTKEKLCDRLLKWLEEPAESGRSKRKMRALKGAAKSSNAKKSATKSEPKKRKAAPSKKKTGAAKKAKTAPKKNDIDFDIPGATIEQVRTKVKSIVEKADKNEVTVKAVRKELEEWLDADLTDHKDAVRALAMEALNGGD